MCIRDRFYDNKYIYVGVYCKESHPEKMNRFIGNRDDNSMGDLISVDVYKRQAYILSEPIRQC